MQRPTVSNLISKAGACVVSIAVVIAWFIFWLGTYPASRDHAAQKVWHNATAQVTSVSDVMGSNARNAYRVVNLSYRDFQGNPQVKYNVLMPHTTRVGQQEPVVVNRDGRIWIENNLRERNSNPRNPSNDLGAFMVRLPFPWIIAGGIAGGAAYLLLMGMFGLLGALKRLLTKPALMQIVWRKLMQFSRRIWDATRLRLEFYRRRKRLRPSPAYKSIRRFQAELLRMDPTPQVIAARRKANELLTRVIERDNQRVEVIDSTIDAIREDVELDHQARREAHKELESA